MNTFAVLTGTATLAAAVFSVGTASSQAPPAGNGNKPNIVTIDAVIPAKANGVLYKLGANSGGLTCFVEEGILCYEYNLFIIQRTKIRAKEKLPIGKVKIEIATSYVVPRPGAPLKVTMTVSDKVVDSVRQGRC